MMEHVLVPIGDHGTPPVPATTPDDVHRTSSESVGSTYNSPDVVIMLKVLDRDVEVMAASVEMGNDSVAAPVTVGVDHVAAVAVSQQQRVVVVTNRPLTGPRTYADGLAELPLGWTGLLGHRFHAPTYDTTTSTIPPTATTGSSGRGMSWS